MSQHVDNQLRQAITSWVKEDLAIFNESRDNLLNYLEDSEQEVKKILQRINQSYNEMIRLDLKGSTSRELILANFNRFNNELKQYHNQVKRLKHLIKSFGKESKDLFDVYNEELTNYEVNEDELIAYLDQIEPIEIKSFGQTILIDFSKLRDLEMRTLRVFQKIDLNSLKPDLTSYQKRIQADQKEFEGVLKKIIDQHVKLDPLVSELVTLLSSLNLADQTSFHKFVDLVKEALNLAIELEVYTPDFNYDVLLAQYYEAIENNDRNGFVDIAIQIGLSPEEVFQSSNEELHRLIDSYFGI